MTHQVPLGVRENCVRVEKGFKYKTNKTRGKTRSAQRAGTCVWSETVSCASWSAIGSDETSESDWSNASSCPLWVEKQRCQCLQMQRSQCMKERTDQVVQLHLVRWRQRWWTGPPALSSSRSPAPWQRPAGSSLEASLWRCWSD